jgi:hypothetical protein
MHKKPKNIKTVDKDYFFPHSKDVESDMEPNWKAWWCLPKNQ